MVSKPPYDQMAHQLCQFYVPGQPSNKTVQKKLSGNYLETIRVCQKSGYVKNPGMSKIRVCQKSGYVKNPGMSKIRVCQKCGYVKLDSRNCLSGNYPAIQRTVFCAIRNSNVDAKSELPLRSHAHADTWHRILGSLQRHGPGGPFPQGICQTQMFFIVFLATKQEQK